MKRWLLLLMMGIILGLATIAVAQDNDPSVSPDNVEKLPEARPILEYALAGGRFSVP